MKPYALLLAALVAAIVVAGCGGGSSSGGGGEPASLAPATAPVYLEADLAPEAKESEELDQLAQNVLGIEDVGEYITEQIEKSAVVSEGQKFNFEEEVEPWLGEKVGLYLTEYNGDKFSGGGIALETSNPGETEEFFEKHTEESKEEVEEGEFEGDKYWVSPADESVIGVVGDYLAYAETKADFEATVETAEGEGLNESSKFKQATEAAAENGVGRIYVDIGGLIEQAKGQIPAESEAVFDMVGIEPRQATAVATVIPHSEQVEIDFSSNLGKTSAPGGDATSLLESLPATAVLGFASAEFGKSFGEGIDELSEGGIPGQIEPGELKPALESVGINLDSIAASIGDAGGFVEGAGVGSLGGALVIETDSASEAKNTISNVGLLLRAAGTKGVTATGGELAGFSVHSASIGPKPLIVGAAGEKIVIAYGPKAAAQALRKNTKTLGSTPDFEAAKSTLGSTPIDVFLDGGPALKLLDALLSPEEQAEIAVARPFLQKISYAAIGSEAKGSATTAKMIVGFEK